MTSALFGAFHRMGLTLDGRHVVFEVTDDFTVLNFLTGATVHLVPPEQEEGIFIVRTDGRGKRRLGPASRDRNFRVILDAASPTGVRTGGPGGFCFSPDGREVVLTDLGPGPGGEDAVQIFTLDIVTREYKQRTQLPVVADRPVGASVEYAGTAFPCFLPDGRITFQSFGNLDGANPEGSLVNFIMNRDGSDLRPPSCYPAATWSRPSASRARAWGGAPLL